MNTPEASARLAGADLIRARWRSAARSRPMSASSRNGPTPFSRRCRASRRRLAESCRQRPRRRRARPRHWPSPRNLPPPTLGAYAPAQPPFGAIDGPPTAIPSSSPGPLFGGADSPSLPPAPLSQAAPPAFLQVAQPVSPASPFAGRAGFAGAAAFLRKHSVLRRGARAAGPSFRAGLGRRGAGAPVGQPKRHFRGPPRRTWLRDAGASLCSLARSRI